MKKILLSLVVLATALSVTSAEAKKKKPSAPAKPKIDTYTCYINGMGVKASYDPETQKVIFNNIIGGNEAPAYAGKSYASLTSAEIEESGRLLRLLSMSGADGDKVAGAAVFEDGYGLYLVKFVDSKKRTLGGAGQRDESISFGCGG